MGHFVQLRAIDGFESQAYFAQPKTEPRGAIVVLPEIFGVNSHIRNIADGFAFIGFLAIAPATFSRVKKDVDLGYTAPDVEIGRALKNLSEGLPPPGVMADVQAATFEAFVPQMLNFESVDGVNFKKGCYPGQEVVARSQFRGTLKRRAYLTSASAVLQAGEEVFSASDPSQPSGVVAQACHHTVHGHWALVCLQNSALEEDAGGMGTAQGAGLTLHPLPYDLRDDI